jgi:hypothetical protein
LAKNGFDRDGTNTKKQILLFSDGAQNTAPNVQVVSNRLQISDNMGANFADYPTYPIDPTGIRICPVTAGPLVPPASDLQQQIADASCSTINEHTPNSDQSFTAAIETFFEQTLSAILPTDRLELVVDNIGTVLRGNSVTEKFLGSASDVKMSLYLSWSGGTDNDRILPISLKAPDGTPVDLANRTSFGHSASFTTISFPLIQNGSEVMQKGEWALTISGAALHDPSTAYHLIVMEDNPTIVSEFTMKARNVGTGEPIPIQVKLTDGGVPVLNATVEAQLMGPSHSQGNVLSTTPAPSASNPSPNDSASNKGQAKLDGLYSDPANASLFADKSLPTLTLLDNGNLAANTDTTAHDGIYSGAFNDTPNEGYYYFTVRVWAKSAMSGDLQRTYQIARFVRSKPDSGKTVFKLLSYDTQANGTVLAKLQAIPHDSLGNFLGPGYEKDMQIKSSDGIVENPLDDKLDGSYEIMYRLPSASSNPSFTIQIIGATVTTKTLKQLQGRGLCARLPGAGASFILLTGVFVVGLMAYRPWRRKKE